LPWVAPQPGEAGRGTQFPELGSLLLRDRNRLAVAGLGRRRIAHCQQHVAAQPKRLSLKA
jgi:hypothetical protein